MSRRVVIKCPNTGREVPVGMNMDLEGWAASSFTDCTLGNCPACGKDHLWSTFDAFLEEP